MNSTSNNSNQILGYDRKGSPITKPKPGTLTTQAAIICGSCSTVIRYTGGPRTGSICSVCASNGLFTTQEQADKLTIAPKSQES